MATGPGSEVDGVPFCQGHGFRRFLRDVWYALLPGMVKEEGQRLQEFLVRWLKEIYEAEYLAMLSIGSSSERKTRRGLFKTNGPCKYDQKVTIAGSSSGQTKVTKNYAKY